MNNKVTEPNLGDSAEPYFLAKVGAPQWSALRRCENTKGDSPGRNECGRIWVCTEELDLLEIWRT